MSFIVNTRSLQSPLTGVQRYTTELLARMSAAECIAPAERLSAVRGHLWEQGVLPRLAAGRLLWSPANTGPLAYQRQVVTIHDASVFENSEWFDRRFGGWYRWLLPRLARRAAHVLTVSEFSRERLQHFCGVGPDRISAIPLGVHEQFRQVTPESIWAARAALGVPEGNYFLTLGTLEPRKNLQCVVSAWELARAELPVGYSLVVAGGRGASHVFRSAKLSLPPGIHLTERVPGELLPSLLAGAEAFFTASLYEGFGLPPLEAATAGTAVVASDLPVHREVLRDGALYFDPADPEQAAQAMLTLAGNAERRSALRAAGTANAARFSWSSAARATEAILIAHV